MNKNKQILKNMQNFLNKKAIIMEPNKFAGKKGTTIRVEMIPGRKKPAMIVELDEGHCVAVDSPSELFFILTEIRQDKIKDN